jgi:hypothetical protein
MPTNLKGPIKLFDIYPFMQKVASKFSTRLLYKNATMPAFVSSIATVRDKRYTNGVILTDFDYKHLYLVFTTFGYLEFLGLNPPPPVDLSSSLEVLSGYLGEVYDASMFTDAYFNQDLTQIPCVCLPDDVHIYAVSVNDQGHIGLIRGYTIA